MATNVNGIYKIRRGTNAGLAAVVLFDGELGYATDTKMSKMGDGVTAWSSLASTGISGATTAATLALRDASGRLQAADASGATDLMTKQTTYTKVEVQAIINGLITKINGLQANVTDIGLMEITDISNLGLPF